MNTKRETINEKREYKLCREQTEDVKNIMKKKNPKLTETIFFFHNGTA